MPLKATKEGNVIKLSGTLDEEADLDATVGSVTGNVTFHCGEVTRINSVGVKTWIKYFTEISKSGAKFTFEELSPALVEQAGLIKNFTCGGPIQSFLAPYHCASCKQTVNIGFKSAGMKADDSSLPPKKCPNCGGEAVFDDIAEEYLSFLP